jgi:hypothetical protein
MDNLGYFALHWLPHENRWETISWDAWGAFREIAQPFAPLPGVSGGIHYFVTGVHGHGATINIITHKYLIQPDGLIGRDNFAGLTREERADFSRLMMAMEEGPGDAERLQELREKMDVDDPPSVSYDALVRALPGLPAPGSLAAERLAKLRRA